MCDEHSMYRILLYMREFHKFNGRAIPTVLFRTRLEPCHLQKLCLCGTNFRCSVLALLFSSVNIFRLDEVSTLTTKHTLISGNFSLYVLSNSYVKSGGAFLT